MRALLLSTLLIAGVSFGALAQTAAEVTATCRDGTTWSGTSRRGACSGHHGVQAFGTGSAAVAPAAGQAVNPVIPAPAATSPTTASPTAPVTPVPGTVQGRAAPAPAGGGVGQVWVNTDSKVYHCQGDRWYGKTRHGSYMVEAAAKAEGDRPSRGKTCS